MVDPVRGDRLPFERLGRYRIVAKLGRGAFGDVFHAHDEALRRESAIKILNPTLANDEAARQRLLHEASTAASLKHPGVVSVHDVGVHAGQLYMAMELLDGEDLADQVREDRLPALGARIAIVEQVCEALAYAHGRQVVYNNVDPSNVRILKGGGVKLMGFSHALHDADEAPFWVYEGFHLVTPGDVCGERASTRSDVFALGILSYELLSGQRPVTAHDVGGVRKAVVLRSLAPLLKVAPTVPPAVGAVMDRALARLPQDRYADGGEMLEALRSASVPPGPAR